MHELLTQLYGAGFFLQGSRYFGTNRQDSDWDFFCDDGDNRYDWLESNGFVQKVLPYYDSLTVTTWKHPVHPVEVSTRIDEDTFKKALAYISLSGDYHHALDKARKSVIERVEYMDNLYNIVRGSGLVFRPIVKYPVENVQLNPYQAFVDAELLRRFAVNRVYGRRGVGKGIWDDYQFRQDWDFPPYPQ